MSKGIEFERELRNVLEAAGYSVMRGAGSKGEAFGMAVDLIATRQTGRNSKNAYMVLVQCKVKGRKHRKGVMKASIT